MGYPGYDAIAIVHGVHGTPRRGCLPACLPEMVCGLYQCITHLVLVLHSFNKHQALAMVPFIDDANVTSWCSA
jgi:hypothetical protein